MAECLHRHGVDINFVNDVTCVSPLLMCASHYEKNPKLIKKLIELGADVNQLCNQGNFIKLLRRSAKTETVLSAIMLFVIHDFDL